jgi:hypothetical protein
MTHIADRQSQGSAPTEVQHKLGLAPWCTAVSSAGSDWVDALDPSLPAEPELPLQTSISERPAPAHKVVLCSFGFAASALAIGYFGAAWLLS